MFGGFAPGPILGLLGLLLFIAILGWLASRMRVRNDETWSRVAARHGLEAHPGLEATGTVEGRAVVVRGWYKPIRHKRRPETLVSVTLLRPVPVLEADDEPSELAAALERVVKAGCVLRGEKLIRSYPGFIRDEVVLDDAIALVLCLAKMIDRATEGRAPLDD